MARFNEKSAKTSRVTNNMGAPAFVTNPKLELVQILLTSFAQDKYYESASAEVTRLKACLAEVDAEFAAKAAVFARTEFGMRSVTHILAGELAKRASGTPWGRKFYNAIVKRPDDMLEILSYYYAQDNKHLSAAIKDGFRTAFGRFDKYQLAKYRGEGKKIKLIDVLRLVRPKPTDKNGDALELLVKGELKSTNTWEAKVSKAGQVAESEEEKLELKKDAWTELLVSGKIGQFALLRNLRNIYESAPEMVDRACELLTNEKRNLNSLILPFRFLTA